MSKSHKDSSLRNTYIRSNTYKIIPNYFSDTLYRVVSSQNSYCNIIGQFSFISFTTCMACPLLKLKHSILLVMLQLVKQLLLQNEQKIQHYTCSSLTVISLHALLLTPIPIGYINSKCHIKKPKSSRTF